MYSIFAATVTFITLPQAPARARLTLTGLLAGLMSVLAILVLVGIPAHGGQEPLREQLIQSDRRLNHAYQQALASGGEADKKTLQHGQRQWLRQRDRTCGLKDLPDDREAWYGALLAAPEKARCVVAQNTARITRLSAGETGTPGRASTANTQSKYPPYPEIWYRALPGPEFKHRHLSFFQMENGDYLIAYNKGEMRYKDGSRVHGAIYFFGGGIIKEVNLMELLGKYRFIKGISDVTLSSGVEISIKNLDPRAIKRCPQSLNYYYSIHDGKTNTTQRKSLLYILKEPRERKINPRCTDTPEPAFYEKVVSIAGELIQLSDGDFLIYSNEKGGFALRFDSQLNTKASILGKELFWVDTTLVEQFRNKANENYQAMHNYLYEHLKKEAAK